MSALLDSNPAYRQVKILRVDWDKFSGGQLAQELKIPRRSILVMFNRGQEVGRVVARTDRASIEALFKAVM